MFSGAVFGQVTRCAGLERTHTEFFLTVHGKYQHREFGLVAPQQFQGLYTVAIWQRNIQYDYVELMLTRQTYGLGRIFSFTSDFHVFAVQEYLPQPLAQDRMIVYQQYFYF
ncbi:protein of unknown function [Georgfuchsia toluolica]|uniref:Uncharacterized protein n=1 Tax=Georgfuchsia toluolica TaxID=424218 RepID=A0A916J084_9PROT|nr:protein of unknown function [Georgfuchsia toluolica]